MAEQSKKYSKELLNKTVVTKSGKRFGEVKDLIFDTRTGELIQLMLKSPTDFATNIELEQDKNNNLLIPFSAVMAVGDFVVVSEEDIL